MNRDTIDPSLCSGEPLLESLEDGFSPPTERRHTMSPTTPVHHPVEPEPVGPEADDAAPNPSQLPIQPEFGPMLPPSEPEDPGAKSPHL